MYVYIYNTLYHILIKFLVRHGSGRTTTACAWLWSRSLLRGSRCGPPGDPVANLMGRQYIGYRMLCVCVYVYECVYEYVYYIYMCYTRVYIYIHMCVFYMYAWMLFG